MKNHKVLKFFALCLSLTITLCLLVSCDAADAGDASLPLEKEEVMGGMTSDGNSGSTVGKPEGAEDLYQRKIIRTVTMSCETKSFDDALSHILDTLAEYDGYVQTSSVKGTGYIDGEKSSKARVASYTLRVPAQALDGYLAALRVEEGIRVTAQSATSDEITSNYYDIQTRISTLEIERDSLQQMLAGFTDYKDINAMLSVQERLYNVIEEIEALKTQLKLYDNQVDMSTIHLTLNEVITYTEVADPSFGERITNAFTQSWKNFAELWQDIAVGLAGGLPFLLVLGVFGGIVALIVTGSLKASRKKKSSDDKK